MEAGSSREDAPTESRCEGSEALTASGSERGGQDIGPIRRQLLQEAVDRRRARERQLRAPLGQRRLWSSAMEDCVWGTPKATPSGSSVGQLTAERYDVSGECSSVGGPGCPDLEDSATTAASGELPGDATPSLQEDVEVRYLDWDCFLMRNSAFVEEKAILLEALRLQKVQQEMQECTFEPRLMANAMDTCRGRPRTTDIYERGLDEMRRKEEKIQRLREEKLEKELRGCSFKPPRRPAGARPQARLAPAAQAASTGRAAQRDSYAAAASARRSLGRGQPSVATATRTPA